MTERLSGDIINEEFKNRIKCFDDNFKDINERICCAAEKSGRIKEKIILLAATKTVPAEVINHAIASGISYIGENRVQEYLSKFDDLKLTGVKRHMIGHLQTNKVKMLSGKVDMIESVDSVRLAEQIGSLYSAENPIDILLEVNIGGEESKSGINPQELLDMIYKISQISGVKVRGLMAIPPICDEKSQLRRFFAQMRKLFIDICDKKIDNSSMDYLSMGMSDDFDIAIEEGANIVRIGSALFGKRI